MSAKTKIIVLHRKRLLYAGVCIGLGLILLILLLAFRKVTDVNDGESVPTMYVPGVYTDRKSTRLNSSHITRSRMPSSA